MSEFTVNAGASRYELLTSEGALSIADYAERGAVRAITHVETPPEVQGRGHAAALMTLIVEHARSSGIQLRPLCSYARTWFARHDEARDVLA